VYLSATKIDPICGYLPAMNHFLIQYFAVRQRLAHFLVHIRFIIVDMNTHSHSWNIAELCALVLVRTRLRRRLILISRNISWQNELKYSRLNDRYTTNSYWSATLRPNGLVTFHSHVRSDWITRGHPAPLPLVAPPKFPMMIQRLRSGTSDVRGPLNSIEKEG
jgi:hypothetical protein